METENKLLNNVLDRTVSKLANMLMQKVSRRAGSDGRKVKTGPGIQAD